MHLLTAENITKAYSEKPLLKDITVNINVGDKIGLIGVNGTGKSTLLKIIAGAETSDSGDIKTSNKTIIEYLPQDPDFSDDGIVFEEVFFKSVPRENEEEEWMHEVKVKTILSKLGIENLTGKISHLSGGQKKRIALARVLINECDLLILDEPTNHLDNETIQWLEKYLNNRKGSLLMVTHDRYFLERVCNRIAEIDFGKIYNYEGNYEKFLELKADREERERNTERKRQSVLRKELAWIQRGARARSTKQKARIERYEDLKVRKAPEELDKVNIKAGASRLGKKTIELENISKSYGENKLVDNFSYILSRDDRIGIIGPNGIGKSTLLNIISGKIEPDKGEVITGETVKVGYFGQGNTEMNENLKVIEYIREVAEYLPTPDGLVSASQMLEEFLFPPTVQWTQISKLSGGEKRRLYLLRVLMGAPNIILLDEPTNDLDIQTLTILEAYLEDFPGAVIAVSHDRYFVDRITEKIFAFKGAGEIEIYYGNYSEYLEEKEEKEIKIKKEEAKEKTLNERKKTSKLTYMEQKEFEEIDDKIITLEEEIKQLEVKINEAAKDYETLKELLKKKEQLDNKLNETMDRWVYLTEKGEYN